MAAARTDIVPYQTRRTSKGRQHRAASSSGPSRIVGQSPHDRPPLGDLDGPGVALSLSVIVNGSERSNDQSFNPPRPFPLSRGPCRLTDSPCMLLLFLPSDQPGLMVLVSYLNMPQAPFTCCTEGAGRRVSTDNRNRLNKIRDLRLMNSFASP